MDSVRCGGLSSLPCWCWPSLRGRVQALSAACAREDFARAVDRAGAALRQLNADNTPRLRAKMRRAEGGPGLAGRGLRGEGLRGPAGRAHGRAGCAGQRPAGQARYARHGRSRGEPDCAKLQELTATSLELQATVKAKAAYTLAKLDQMLGGALALAPRAQGQERRQAPEPSAPAQPTPQTPPRAAPDAGSWTPKPAPPAEVAIAPQPPAPPPAQSAPPSAVPAARAASRDGRRRRATPSTRSWRRAPASSARSRPTSAPSSSTSSRSSGRPTGYILGTEGGGAFLAGVRYGKGTLYMRAGSTQTIYWHGPSLGTDVGADGSKTLFLIYRLKSPEQHLRELHRHRRLGLFRRRRRRHARHQRQRHPGADPLGRRPAARRQHRLHPLHRARDVEPVLTHDGVMPTLAAHYLCKNRYRAGRPLMPSAAVRMAFTSRP